MFRFLKYVIGVSMMLIFFFLFSGLIMVFFPFLSKVVLYAIIVIFAFIFVRSLYFWLLRVGSNK